MDVDAPFEDELVSSLPIHYSNSLAPNLQLHQFPLLTRPLQVPPSAERAGKRITSRVKPETRRYEIHVPVDVRPEVWNTDKAKELGSARQEDDREKNQELKMKMKDGEEPRLSEIRLRSEEIPQRGVYMMGIVRDGKLHLQPINQTHQFRPTLTYLDAQSRRARKSGNDSDSDDGPPPDPDDPNPVVAPKKEKKAPAGEAKEVQVSAKRADDKAGVGAGASSARREMLQILRSEEDEAWEALEFCDVSTDVAGTSFESVFSQYEEKLQCKSDITMFVRDIEGL
ncbi:DNA-directed RNA polymerase III subunit Rpc5 [Coprinopsis sp. MPI-PUGE-AT-0042]|nr:DNA-directed RNA polymerase III subunit Rpc5 [Coprinopsis sp. MPI-PUGE-AT-0042]